MKERQTSCDWMRLSEMMLLNTLSADDGDDAGFAIDDDDDDVMLLMPVQ